MYKCNFVLLILTLGFFALSAQENRPYNGTKTINPEKYLITRATVHVSPNETLTNTDILIDKGRIVKLGQGLSEKGAVLIDLQNTYHVYPGFIDLYSNYGLSESEKSYSKKDKRPQFLSNKPGAYAWNEALKTEFRAATEFSEDSKERERLHGFGINTVLTQRFDGFSRGSAALVQLNKHIHTSIIESEAAHAMSFSKGSSRQDYPRSLMGTIALLKQAHYDAVWYKNQSEFTDLSLDAWNNLEQSPLIFAVGNKWELMNAVDIAKTMNAPLIIKGNNDEYQRIEMIKSSGAKLVLPLSFPDAFKFEDEYDIMHVQYAEMKHWELAPYNAKMLHENDIEFAFSSYGLKTSKDFFLALKTLRKNGLAEEEILAALTTTPAKWLGKSDELGKIEPGFRANLFISQKAIFSGNPQVKSHFVNGQIQDEFKPRSKRMLGTYTIQSAGNTDTLKLEKQKAKWSWFHPSDSLNTSIKTLTGDKITFTLPWPDSSQMHDFILLPSSEKWEGLSYDTEGNSYYCRLNLVDENRNTTESKKAKTEKEIVFDPFEKLIYPFQAYGNLKSDKPNSYLIKNATVWTNEKQGVIDKDVMVIDGKIAEIGENLNPNKRLVIDAKGKHLTSGIIDEHSHIALRRGVNEGTQASSAEVKISDVINPDDVNIYRHLAGGVTAVQQLHGSANPIGGQSSLIKLKWGNTAEQMKIENTDGFIKFALGENVKQSNWGSNKTIRYPQTRMGVEQVFRDYFNQALRYQSDKASKENTRTDLEMEALSQILNKERFISCHSYQQGEINMLMKLAEDYDIRVNTFTHILEGYKVADKMAKHGAGASTFSDWWAYKYEVIDAIPYNAAILHKMGVVTAINSDDGEMARRLNQEAAKIVKYGDISEEDAWKMVTLNPAKLLHLDDRMGSIKPGKDADLVIWSTNPLSSYAVVENTFIDGEMLYDRSANAEMEAEILKEKMRIMKKMMGSKGDKKAIKQKEEKHYHCDDDEDEMK